MYGTFTFHVRVDDRSIPSGYALAESYIRLTPTRRKLSVTLWNKTPVTSPDWEVEFEFHVTGQQALRGDGYGFWFTDSPEELGPVFGSRDKWRGLGLFFDGKLLKYATLMSMWPQHAWCDGSC